MTSAIVESLDTLPRPRRITVVLATDAAGACTVRTPALAGHVLAYHLAIGTLEGTTDLTVTEADTGAVLLTLTDAAASMHLRAGVPLHDETGQDTGAVGPPAVVGPLTITVAGGGDTKAGSLDIDLDGWVAE